MSGGEITGKRGDILIIDDPHYDKDQTREAVEKFLAGMTSESRMAFLTGRLIDDPRFGPDILGHREPSIDPPEFMMKRTLCDVAGNERPKGNRKARRASKARARK